MKQKKSKCMKNKIFLDIFFMGADFGRQEQFIDHIFSCPECRLKFETLNALRRELRTKEKELPCTTLSAAEAKAFRRMAKSRLRELNEKQPKPFFNRDRSRLFRILTASAALIVFFLAGYFLFHLVIKQKSFRASNSSNVHLIEPLGKLKAIPTFFRWSSVKGTDYYRFKIIDEDLQTICVFGVNQTTIRISESDKNKLNSGKIYIWSIEAHNDEDKVISFSQDYFVIDTP
jgi:hypothetical protein